MKERLLGAAFVAWTVGCATGEILLAIAAGYYELLSKVWLGKEKRP